MGRKLGVGGLLLVVVLFFNFQLAGQEKERGGVGQVGEVTIRNDFYEVDQNGQHVSTRSGCLRQFNGLYYWYGGTNRFLDHTFFVSSDLVLWTYKGEVLRTDVDANRLDVL